MPTTTNQPEDGGIAEARNLYDEDAEGYEGADPSTRMVWFRDVTIRIDSDGDGIAELMRYYIVGDKILYRAKAENVYYAALCPLANAAQACRAVAG